MLRKVGEVTPINIVKEEDLDTELLNEEKK